MENGLPEIPHTYEEKLKRAKRGLLVLVRVVIVDKVLHNFIVKFRQRVNIDLKEGSF